MDVDLHVFGDFLGVLGEILIAYTAIAVHHRVRKRHKIDERVFKVMRRENILGFLGILLVALGFIIRTVAS